MSGPPEVAEHARFDSSHLAESKLVQGLGFRT